MLLPLLLLVLVIVLLVLWLRQYLRRKHAFARNIPAIVPKVSFLGLDLTLATLNDVDRFESVWTMFLNHERLFKMLIGPIMLIGVCDPDLMQKVLSHSECLEKPYFYDFVGHDQGIFSAKYHLWKGQRKALNPTFNLKILNSFVPIFVTCSRQLASSLNKLSDGETVNMFEYTARCTLEMVCGTTLGSDVLQREGKDLFLHNLEQLFDNVSRRMLSVHLYPDVIYQLTSIYKKDQAMRKMVAGFAGGIVKEKKDKYYAQIHFNENNNIDSEPEANDYRKPQLFIDQLLSMADSDRPFTDKEILDNVLTIMVAGNDTSGLEVAHACLFLAMYPDLQERVYAEVVEHFPNDEVAIHAESLKRLEYTEMFLKECLRHCPVAPHIARQNLEDMEVDGNTIPAGNIFIFSFYALHRRQDIWGPNADRFDPENFAPERCKNRHPFAFMPFSTGVRNCIGGRYAMISIKVMILFLVRNFRLRTRIRPEDLKFKFGMTLKLPFQHLIQIEKRHNEEITRNEENLL